jgi:hypothetical protein
VEVAEQLVGGAWDHHHDDEDREEEVEGIVNGSSEHVSEQFDCSRVEGSLDIAKLKKCVDALGYDLLIHCCCCCCCCLLFDW